MAAFFIVFTVGMSGGTEKVIVEVELKEPGTIIQEVVKEIPVESIKEIEIVREIPGPTEIIREEIEIPVEIIREVEVVKEVIVEVPE